MASLEQKTERLKQIKIEIGKLDAVIAKCSTPEAIRFRDGFISDRDTIRKTYGKIDISLPADEVKSKVIELQAQEKYLTKLIDDLGKPSLHKKQLEIEKQKLVKDIETHKDGTQKR